MYGDLDEVPVKAENDIERQSRLIQSASSSRREWIERTEFDTVLRHKETEAIPIRRIPRVVHGLT